MEGTVRSEWAHLSVSSSFMSSRLQEQCRQEEFSSPLVIPGWQMEKDILRSAECHVIVKRWQPPRQVQKSCDTGAGNTGCSFQPWFYFQWSHDLKPTPSGLQVLFRKKGYWSSALDSRCSTTLTFCAWTLGQQPLEALGAWRDAAPRAPPRSTASGPAFHKTPRWAVCTWKLGDHWSSIPSSFIILSFHHKWSRAVQFHRTSISWDSAKLAICSWGGMLVFVVNKFTSASSKGVWSALSVDPLPLWSQSSSTLLSRCVSY